MTENSDFFLFLVPPPFFSVFIRSRLFLEFEPFSTEAKFDIFVLTISTFFSRRSWFEQTPTTDALGLWHHFSDAERFLRPMFAIGCFSAARWDTFSSFVSSLVRSETFPLQTAQSNFALRAPFPSPSCFFLSHFSSFYHGAAFPFGDLWCILENDPTQSGLSAPRISLYGVGLPSPSSFQMRPTALRLLPF